MESAFVSWHNDHLDKSMCAWQIHVVLSVRLALARKSTFCSIMDSRESLLYTVNGGGGRIEQLLKR